MPGQEGDPDGWYIIAENDSAFEKRFASADEAQAACDRLNLRAVLDALQAPHVDLPFADVVAHLIAQCKGNHFPDTGKKVAIGND